MRTATRFGPTEQDAARYTTCAAWFGQLPMAHHTGFIMYI